MARLYYGFHKSFILYGDFWKEIIEILKKNLFIREEDEKVFQIASQPDQVPQLIDSLEKEHSQHLKNIIANEGAFMLGYQGPEFKPSKRS